MLRDLAGAELASATCAPPRSPAASAAAASPAASAAPLATSGTKPPRGIGGQESDELESCYPYSKNHGMDVRLGVEHTNKGIADLVEDTAFEELSRQSLCQSCCQSFAKQL